VNREKFTLHQTNRLEKPKGGPKDFQIVIIEDKASGTSLLRELLSNSKTVTPAQAT
jgi:hypothetical protein